METIDQKLARRLILNSQGLLTRDPFGVGVPAVQRAIERLSYVQIDTISVVDRAHHHILKNRVSTFAANDLHSLLSKQKTIFEYWSHAAAYLPMQDFRYCLATMSGYRKQRPVDAKMSKEIIRRIRTEGPCQPKNFLQRRTQPTTGWWDWSPVKRVMENMFLAGELMVCERRGFQKVYDLTENVLPEDVDLSQPTAFETGCFYVRAMLGALGIATARDIGYARATLRRLAGVDILPAIEQALLALKESGEVLEFSLNGQCQYVLQETLEKVPSRIGQRRAIILSPFDNLVINRARLSEQFGFKYVLECYLPQAKRRYGYFTLPILFGDQFIARVDAKAHRKQSVLEIKNIWFEQLPDQDCLEACDDAFRRFAKQLNCQTIQLPNTRSNRQMANLLSVMRQQTLARSELDCIVEKEI